MLLLVSFYALQKSLRKVNLLRVTETFNILELRFKMSVSNSDLFFLTCEYLVS